MALSVLSITVDSTDPIALAQWWADRLGAEITATNDGWFVTVQGGAAPGQLAFQKVDEVTPARTAGTSTSAHLIESPRWPRWRPPEPP